MKNGRTLPAREFDLAAGGSQSAGRCGIPGQVKGHNSNRLTVTNTRARSLGPAESCAGYLSIRQRVEFKLGVILYIIFAKVCLYALTLYPATARLRCFDRYIRCHRLLAVKPLSPREHAGRRVRKGTTLGSVQTTDHGRRPWYRHSVIRSLGAE